MALSGNWRNSQQREAGALKWGTGINPVHSIVDNEGREIATHGTTVLVDPALVEQYHDDDYADYEAAAETEADSGTDVYPNLGTPTQLLRDNAGRWPQWGTYEQGIPGGTVVRGEDHGASLGNTPNQTPTETVSEGWRNKETGDVELAEGAAVEQVYRQTSEQQLFQTRQGSQRGNGSDSDYTQPIPSRVPGQKIKVFSTGQRLYDMLPREQFQRIRPWWSRGAGTGRVHWMEANAEQPVRPRTREIPPEPSTGPPAIAHDDYGYQSEDMIPYA